MRFSQEIITSRQNRRVVELCKLADRKAREATRSFRFDGIKLLEEALKNGIVPETVFLRRRDAERLYDRFFGGADGAALAQRTCILTLSDELFDKISEEKSPEGVICCAKYIDKFQKNITIYNSADFFQMKNEQIVLLPPSASTV